MEDQGVPAVPPDYPWPQWPEYPVYPVYPSLSGPFKCTDCGVWWAGFEHRCRGMAVYTSDSTAPWPITDLWRSATGFDTRVEG